MAKSQKGCYVFKSKRRLRRYQKDRDLLTLISETYRNAHDCVYNYKCTYKLTHALYFFYDETSIQNGATRVNSHSIVLFSFFTHPTNLNFDFQVLPMSVLSSLAFVNTAYVFDRPHRPFLRGRASVDLSSRQPAPSPETYCTTLKRSLNLHLYNLRIDVCR